MEQFPQIPVGLENARPLGALNPLFKLHDHPLEQGGEGDHSENLRDLQQDITHDGKPLFQGLEQASAKRQP